MVSGKDLTKMSRFVRKALGDFLWRIALLDIAGRLVVLNAVIRSRLSVVEIGRRLVSLGLPQ